MAVDGAHQVIVAVGISNQASDSPHLLPMLEWILSNTRQLPDKLLADAGICSTDTIEVSRGLDRFLLRGTENTFGELNLIAIIHNLIKLHRATLNHAGGAESRRQRRPTASQGQGPLEVCPSRP
jgi:hypothetical protein